MKPRAKEDFGGHEPFSTNTHGPAVWQSVLPVNHRSLVCELLFRLEAMRDVAKSLLHLSNGLEVRSGVQRMPTADQEFHQLLRDVPTSEVHPLHQRGLQVTLRNRHKVSNAVARIHHEAGVEASRVEGQDSLYGHIHGAEAVALEHGLHNALAVVSRIQDRLSLHHFVLGVVLYSQLREGIVPHCLDILPILDDAILHRSRELQHGAGTIRLVPDHEVSQTLCSCESLVMPQHRPTDQGWEDDRWFLLICEAGLDDAGPRIANDRPPSHGGNAPGPARFRAAWVQHI
mmetsp:Transcript_8786/g.19306  ORF Transcript_8786/g.19306 Transcript_8786/m.19306 type:complete len:287 (-) Transcript_8786:16-876(-)